MRFLLLLLAACGTSPRPFSQITAAVANPTGTVSDTTAPAMMNDNSVRTTLLGAAGTLYAQTPVGFRRDTQTIYDAACPNIGDSTKTIDLSQSEDGGSTGTVVVTLDCAGNDSFTLDVQLKAACTQTTCVEGELKAEATQKTYVWSMYVTTEAPSGGPQGSIDMGGTASVDPALGFTDDQVVEWFGKKPAPILLAWSAAGINDYSDFYLSGAAKYECHADTSSGSCTTLDGTGNDTNSTPIQWGTPSN